MTARTLLTDDLNSPAHGFSIGSFGAIAEFSRDIDEAWQAPHGERLGWITARGGLAVHPRSGLRVVAWESLSKRRDHWLHGMLFCLPEADALITQYDGITELGADAAALRTEDRDGVLFDLGLNQGFVNVAVRTADPHLIAQLRAAQGSQLLAPDNPILRAIVKAGPHRVFTTAIGRLEVRQPIGIERSPQGPHTHVLPKLLATGRACAANVPLPEGWLPVLAAHPAHPCRTINGDIRAFDETVHQQFQHWLGHYGPADFAAQKQRLWTALARGADPADFDPGHSRLLRTATRVALRQACYVGTADEPSLQRWIAAFDGTGEKP